MRRPPPAISRVVLDDRGAGSVLAAAVVTAVLVTTAAMLALVTAFAARGQAQSDADAAALAAADVASGLIAGVPCEVASRAAELGGSRLAACTLLGPVASVTVSRVVVGLDVQVTSRAGPGPVDERQARPP